MNLELLVADSAQRSGTPGRQARDRLTEAIKSAQVSILNSGNICSSKLTSQPFDLSTDPKYDSRIQVTQCHRKAR
jgi:HrpA-like RNA helicase